MKRVPTESPTVRSYRELLGVGPGATGDELKKAYHKLALLYHPDRNPDPGSAAEFQKVRQAYEILLDTPHVRTLNENHLREKLFHQPIAGLNISFGSLFGYRVFGGVSDRVAKSLRLGKEKADETDQDATDFSPGPIEQDASILDNAAYDAIETVYAGKFSVDDEERLQETVGRAGHVRMPWVILNNQGILHFINGDFRRALKCFEELNERIPNNIIFMYRLGLCHVLNGFQNPRRTFLGFEKPNRIEVEKGINLFRKCIRIGETRTVGKQRCLVIRKFLADVLEKTGRMRQARRIWQEILEKNPRSVEATLRVKGTQEARALLKSRFSQGAKTKADAASSTPLLERGKSNR